MNASSRLAWLACLATLAACCLGSARAASLQVSPTAVVVQAREKASGLNLGNNGSADLHAQVRVYRWTQANGEDRLDPTQDIAISPAMLKLAAGAGQLVRIVRLGAPPDSEMSYRVIVDELPVAADAGAASDAGTKPGLEFVLRYSIPVFLMPDADIAPELHARVAMEDGRLQLDVRNTGRQHAQLADIDYVDGKGRHTVLAAGLAGYVLPGQAKRWPLPATIASAAGGTFEARINGEMHVQTLSLDAPAR